MANQDENVHKGHRSKTRKRFMASGFNGAPQHNILELLLFYGIAIKDTNFIAHTLIDKFGSIADVLQASEEELTSVANMSHDSALLLTMILPTHQRYSSIINTHCNELIDCEQICEYMRNNYSLDTPKIYALCFNFKHNLIACLHLADEDLDNCDHILKNLLSLCLQTNAASVVLVHTHPNSLPMPSSEDLNKTKSISKFFSHVHIHLEDHIIISQNKYYSMKNNSKYANIFKPSSFDEYNV
ncbi:MAG: JAB domain-containing protein [Clostridia bacterium]